MIYAVLSDDMIAGRMTGIAGDGVAIPSALASLPDERLRFVSGQIVDAATITAWHIDDVGRKRVQASDGRQPLNCAWNAALVMEDGLWRVRTSTDDLVAYANRRQWAVATAGVLADLGGGVTLAVPTDSTGLTLVNGAVSRVNADSPPASIRWQTGPASFVTLTAAQVKTLGNVVADHVQGTFNSLDSVLAGIASGDVTIFEEIDQVFP